MEAQQVQQAKQQEELETMLLRKAEAAGLRDEAMQVRQC
jgi:hypothetical protein